MALTPLTRVQQATVLALVEARRLDAVPADLARATSFLRQAQERLDPLPLLTSVTVRYGVAYDACHDTGEALLRRTASVRPTGQASTRRSAATCALCSTSLRQRKQRESSTSCDAPATRTATRRSRWGQRRPRRPNRSPGRSSTPPSPEDSRPDRRSANSPQEVPRRPFAANDARRLDQRITAGQTAFTGCHRRRPTMVENTGFRSASTSESARRRRSPPVSAGCSTPGGRWPPSRPSCPGPSAGRRPSTQDRRGTPRARTGGRRPSS